MTTLSSPGAEHEEGFVLETPQAADLPAAAEAGPCENAARSKLL